MQPSLFFKCLSDDTRLRSLLLISAVGEACVCELMTALALDQPKISRHLADLRKCAILQDERRGKWVYYRLHPSLPAWANNVLGATAQHNPEYINTALEKLLASRTVVNCCP